MVMKKTWAFRAGLELSARLEQQCEKRGLSPASVIRIAVELGLDQLETGRRINDTRLAVCIEATQAAVDIIGRQLAPAQMEEVPSIARSRMETYHVAI
jgi:predicted DNA-binding protein